MALMTLKEKRWIPFFIGGTFPELIYGLRIDPKLIELEGIILRD